MDILDELQLIAAQNLERLEVNKYYEVIRELGKGTYGKVDLVIHKIRGKGPPPSTSSVIVLSPFCFDLCTLSVISLLAPNEMSLCLDRSVNI